jgi:hypothetical protein
MTTWAKPSDLMLAYRNASRWESRRHIEWFREQGYPHVKQLEKLFEDREGRAGAGALRVQGRGSWALGADGSGGFDPLRQGESGEQRAEAGPDEGLEDGHAQGRGRLAGLED